MELQVPQKANRLVVVILSAGIFVLALLVIGRLMWEQPLYAVFGEQLGRVLEKVLVNGVLLVAAPLGLLMGIISLVVLVKRRPRTEKILAIVAFALGVAGVLLGALFWLLLLTF
jgi:hypothetical protein